jgi:V/A-type H+-transporting ATPase subunit A
VDAVLSVHDRCQDLVHDGVLASLIEEVDWGRLVRAREDTDPDDVRGVQSRRDEVLARLDTRVPDGGAA